MISRARWRTRSSLSSTRWCPWDATSSCWWWRTATGRITWRRRSWPTSCAMSRRSEAFNHFCDTVSDIVTAYWNIGRCIVTLLSRGIISFKTICHFLLCFSRCCFLPFIWFFASYSLSLIHILSLTHNASHMVSQRECTASITVLCVGWQIATHESVKSSVSLACFFFFVRRWPMSHLSMLQRSSKSLKWPMRTNKKEWWGLKVIT